MTNRERYLDHLLAEVMCLTIRKLRGESNCDHLTDCGTCKRENLKWLKEEYKESELIRHGHWIGGDYDIRKCSVCGGLELGRTQYCPHCGAKMDEVGK